ncbi:LysR family transcriptional regulator [Photobacterium sp. OFAV2-7]|uniref:LysR family transcriptional regulator n=1 Tax=Photobacterium sp. OFAV2-7 TaxID=2917748 RepID=UPI001EF4E1EC|nr:LysR family transcriptional regulator [Photobacterium sp. OFAV2-7]MCG7585952.1 LysR family transcriptional regulator [Photobacterium sp. OFAV2-7]
MSKLQWNLIQSFIEVARTGSLSKAAQVLGTSQPTLSRHMTALEASLNVALFDRSTQGLKLTDVGAQLLECSTPMQEAANSFVRTASGADASLAGNVRISANEVVGLYYLPPLIAEFNDLYPEVQVEIDISNKATSLTKREADIALRMFRPTQPDLVARRLPNIDLKFCASKHYLDKYGRPQSFEDLASHRTLGFDRDWQMSREVQSLGREFKADDFLIRTDFLPLHIEMARQGVGITVTHFSIIKQFPELELLLDSLPIPNLEFWLVYHSDVKYNRRIRVMVEFLAERLHH